MASSTVLVLRLYKQLMKESNKFPSYMYRTYAVQRIRAAFKEHRVETDKEKIDQLLCYGKESLELIKRQIIIGQLFPGPEIMIEQSLQKTTQTVNIG